MGYDCKLKKKINKLTSASRLIDEILNRQSLRNLPFVGSAAFAHKGGLHISAVEKDQNLMNILIHQVLAMRDY